MSAVDTVRRWFVAPPDDAAAAPAGASPHADGYIAPADRLAAATPHPDAGPAAPSPSPRLLTSAAVLGRPGEAEPVAAALALALRRETRAKAAAVAVVGTLPAPVESGGTGTARRVVERLRHHGFDNAYARGRLAWVGVDPDDDRLFALAHRITLVAAPAALAVTAPRTPPIDAVVNAQDLIVVVTSDPDGPLAQLAVSGLGPADPLAVSESRIDGAGSGEPHAVSEPGAVRGGAPRDPHAAGLVARTPDDSRGDHGPPVVLVPPLGRGPARALSRAGIRPARAVRRLLHGGER